MLLIFLKLDGMFHWIFIPHNFLKPSENYKSRTGTLMSMSAFLSDFTTNLIQGHASSHILNNSCHYILWCLWSSFFGRIILLSLAIFMINQMTAKIVIPDDSDQSKGASRPRLNPALGSCLIPRFMLVPESVGWLSPHINPQVLPCLV